MTADQPEESHRDSSLLSPTAEPVADPDASQPVKAKLTKVLTDQDMTDALRFPGLLFLDVYTRWAGPCEAMSALLKKLSGQPDYAERLFVLPAECDNIYELAPFKDKSSPTFLLYRESILCHVIRGANGPLVESTLAEEIERIRNGVPPTPYVETNAEPTAQSANDAAGVEAAQAVPSNGKDVTLALIKPDAFNKAAEIIEIIRRHEFNILREKRFVFTRQQAKHFYRDHSEKPFFKNLVNFMSSGPVVALILEKEHAVESWRSVCGPANSKRAVEDAPNSIRALFGTDGMRNAVHGSDSLSTSTRDIEFVFSAQIQEVAAPPDGAVTSKTLCILQPELVNDYTLPFVLPAFIYGGESVLNLASVNEAEPKRPTTADVPTSAAAVEQILHSVLLRGLTVERMEQSIIEKSKARDLFGTAQEKIDNITSGNSIVFVISGLDAVEAVKELCGPSVPAEARESAPNSFRALYGADAVRNGVFRSESAEAAHREIDIFYPYDNQARRVQTPYVAIEDTVTVIKPDAAANSATVDGIMRKIASENFEIVHRKEMQFTREQAQEFYRDHQGKEFYNDLIAYMTSGPIVALVLRRDNAVAKWREVIGPTDSVHAKEVAPNSIRGLFGIDRIHNAVYGSDSAVQASNDISRLFSEKPSPTAQPSPAAKPSSASGSIKQKPTGDAAKASSRPATATKTQPGTKSSANVTKSTSSVSKAQPVSSKASIGPAVKSAAAVASKTSVAPSRSVAGSKSSIAPAKAVSASKTSVGPPKAAGSKASIGPAKPAVGSAKNLGSKASIPGTASNSAKATVASKASLKM